MIRVGDFPLGKDEFNALKKVYEQNRISEYKHVKSFEDVWAETIGTKHCVLTNSGTSSLIAGMEALKIKNDFLNGGVITSPLTYIATSNAIVKTGCVPIYADIELNTLSVSCKSIKKAADLYIDRNHDENIQGVLPVHLMGFSCDIDQIYKYTVKNNWFLFEDSAQAHGTKYNNKMVGSYGDMGNFSFYIAHNIQAGEMGAITTNDPDLAALTRQIKCNGRLCSCRECTRGAGTCPYKNKDFDPRFTHKYIGYNFKANEFSASLGLSQIPKINNIIKTRQNNVKFLNEELEQLQNDNILKLPVFDSNTSYLAYPIIIQNMNYKREKICSRLEKNGIETRPIFGCIPTQQPAYQKYKNEYIGLLPNADFVGKNGFYVGCHQYLQSNDLIKIVESIKNSVEN